MKAAIFIEEGRSQVVLTPETELEGQLLDLIRSDGNSISIKQGRFYQNLTGYTRQGELVPSYSPEKNSTIIVLDPLPKQCDKPQPPADPWVKP